VNFFCCLCGQDNRMAWVDGEVHFWMLGLWVAWSDSCRGPTCLWAYITGKRHRALWPRFFLRVLTTLLRVDIYTRRRERQFIPK